MAQLRNKSRKPLHGISKPHVKKGDTVMIIAGKDKGKTGTVKSVLKERSRVVVEGLNLMKKAVKPNLAIGQRGGIIEMEAPLAISNVMAYDLKAGKASRTRKTEIDSPKGKKRVRVLVKTQEQLD